MPIGGQSWAPVDRSWLDPIRDMIILRREAVLLEAACAEMDEAYAAAAS